MKILFFMESYYCGGVDSFVINLINAWPDTRDELLLVCNANHAGLKNIKDSLRRPCRIISSPMKVFTGFFNKINNCSKFDHTKLFLLKISAPVMRYCFLAANIIALKKLFKGLAADRMLVINGGYPGGDSCRAATITWGLFSGKPPSIHNFHGIATPARWYMHFQEKYVDWLVARHSKTFITVSKAAVETLACRRTIYGRKKPTYIYSGFERPASPVLADIKKELELSTEDSLCLMLGNYNYNKNFNKGHAFLFDAFKKILAKIPRAHLLICGHGSDRDIEKVKGLAAEFSIAGNVHLFSFRNDIISILQQVDVLLVSAQAFESFGFASIEAMAYGVPVVATNVGALPEIIKDGQGGFCFDKNDSDSYAKKVIELLGDKTLKKQVGERGLERYNKYFTASRMSKTYEQFIKTD